MKDRPLSVPPPESIRAGHIVAGKYRIDALLGAGAMGTVWTATHVNLGSKVAVKLISSDFARSTEAKSRFLAEAKAAAALRSNYVVQVFDSGMTEDGIPYLVMEHLKGESLEERIQRSGRLPLDQAVRILGQVAKGLARAHSHDIVHRDLKPANIFLATTDDGEQIAKILDFGIAKMHREDEDYKATATGVIMGTPLFMSPEQARGLKSVDKTSDLYSLGMVAYTAVVGEVPFHAESFGDLVYMVCTQELPQINEAAPWLPGTMDAWFRRACHKDQAGRFASAEEMYEALLVCAQLSQPIPGLSAVPDATWSSPTPIAVPVSSGVQSAGYRARTPSATVPFTPVEQLDPSLRQGRQSGERQGRQSGERSRLEDSGRTQESAVAFDQTASIEGFLGQASTHDRGVLETDVLSLAGSKQRRGPWIPLAALAILAGAGLAWWVSDTSTTPSSAELSTPASSEQTSSGGDPAPAEDNARAEVGTSASLGAPNAPATGSTSAGATPINRTTSSPNVQPLPGDPVAPGEDAIEGADDAPENANADPPSPDVAQAAAQGSTGRKGPQNTRPPRNTGATSPKPSPTSKPERPSTPSHGEPIDLGF